MIFLNGIAFFALAMPLPSLAKLDRPGIDRLLADQRGISRLEADGGRAMSRATLYTAIAVVASCPPAGCRHMRGTGWA